MRAPACESGFDFRRRAFRVTKKIKLPNDRIARLSVIVGSDFSSMSITQVFDLLARRAGIDVQLNTNQKMTVVRRLGGNKKWSTKTIEDLVIGVLRKEQSRHLRERKVTIDRRLANAMKADRRIELADSMMQPVSRLAGEPEHLQVLVGLPGIRFYKTPEWRATRADALRLAGFRCEWCGATAKTAQLEVDHIATRIIAPERAFDLNNLRVLCEPCHAGRHSAERGAGK
jgi:hypothetical protein